MATGIDLVAEERNGGYCAILCRCYAPDTRISKTHLDSFISASARAPFTSLLIVDTGTEWGPNARKLVENLKLDTTILRFGDLSDCPIDWPDLVREKPGTLSVRRETFHLRPHQQAAFDDVTQGFVSQDRGKLIIACGTGKNLAALRIAEGMAVVRGRVLYLVPSTSQLQRSMHECTEQRDVPHRYIGTEGAILGAVLRDNSIYQVAAERLDASSYLLWKNRKLWAILPDLIVRTKGQDVDAYQLATLQPEGKLIGFKKEDMEEIEAWLLDLKRNRWTGSLAEHVEAVAEARRHRRLANIARKGRTLPQ